MKKMKKWYCWLVVAAGFLMIGTSTGLYYNCTSVFVDYVTRGLGFSRGEFLLASTIMLLFSLPALPLTAAIMKRIPLHKVIFISGIAASVCVFGYSFASKLWHFYTLAACMGLFFPGVQYVTLTAAINRWFKMRRGFALGLAASGAGIAGSVMVPIINARILSHGWQSGYRLMALVGLAFCVTAAVVISVTPQKLGIAPYGAVETGEQEKLRSAGISRKEAMRTPAFYLLLIGIFLICLTGMGVQPHIIPFFMDKGYSSTSAAFIMSVFLFLVLPAKMAIGAIYDSIGVRRAIVLSSCLLFLTALSLRLVGTASIIPWLFTISFGLSYAVLSLLNPYLTSAFFGDLDYAAIFSIISIAGNLGGAAGAMVSCMFYERFGNYDWAWCFYMLLSLIICLILLTGAKVCRKHGNVECAT